MGMTLRVLVIPFVLVTWFAPASAFADELSTARTVIGKQIAHIKASDVRKLKAGFTPRLHDRITSEAVKKAQKELGSMSLDDLVASAKGDGSSIKIKMKNGRTLTTLLRVDGTWLADTLWFR
jgi:hypothetical protein